MKKLLHILLFPFSLIYGIILFIRNKCYDWGILNSMKFGFPVIVVGNLTIGGVGKTPHVEYLIRLLSNTHQIAILSRGYKRKTTGFVMASSDSTIAEIGDEPLQYQKKFNNITVAVDEKRVRGIQLLKTKLPKLGSIILDDAFQHRAVNTKMNILITAANNLYVDDAVLPMGRLREWKSGMKRAQLIVISKCNPSLTEKDKEIITKKIAPQPHQKIYFSAIKYGELVASTNAAKKIALPISKESSALAITGIANPVPFLEEVKSQFKNVEHLNFADHHQFNKADLKKVKEVFSQLKGNNKIIITTEKDLMRLSLPEILTDLEEIPLFYIPIEIYFLGKGKVGFDEEINNYVTTNQ